MREIKYGSFEQLDWTYDVHKKTEIPDFPYESWELVLQTHNENEAWNKGRKLDSCMMTRHCESDGFKLRQNYEFKTYEWSDMMLYDEEQGCWIPVVFITDWIYVTGREVWYPIDHPDYYDVIKTKSEEFALAAYCDVKIGRDFLYRKRKENGEWVEQGFEGKRRVKRENGVVVAYEIIEQKWSESK